MNRFDLSFGDPCTTVGTGRFFSVEQANRALVLVKRIVCDVVAGYARLLELEEIMENLPASADAQPYPAPSSADDLADSAKQEFIGVAENIRHCLEELELVGAELKDWSVGIVDFPHMAGGEEVRLCWQYGEPQIDYWHEVDAGIAARQPIETLPAEGILVSESF